MSCIGLRQSAVSELSKKITTLPLVDSKWKKYYLKHERFKTIKELERYNVDGVDVGYGVVSSLMTTTSNPRFDPQKYKSLIDRSLNEYLKIYYTACKHINENKIDLVYIYNGRFIPSRSWLEACKYKKVNYVTHERFGMPDRVAKIENGLIYESERYKKLIKDFWEKNKENNSVVNEAIDFFEERPKGKNTGWFSFTRDQNHKKLPALWNPQKTNITIFASTEIELQGVNEFFKEALFDDQISAYEEISSKIEKLNKDIHFTIRIHPNSKIETSKWWRSEYFSKQKNITIIEPESDVSSYELMKESDKILVFVSTMGPEATYWGKAAIAISNTCYRGIEAVYEPKSKDELFSLILNLNLPPKPKSNSLSYGAFLRCGTPKLQFSEAIDHCKITFKGIRPNANADVIKSLWRDQKYFEKMKIPLVLKKLWWTYEWTRLKVKHKSIFSNRNT